MCASGKAEVAISKAKVNGYNDIVYGQVKKLYSGIWIYEYAKQPTYVLTMYIQVKLSVPTHFHQSFTLPVSGGY